MGKNSSTTEWVGKNSYRKWLFKVIVAKGGSWWYFLLFGLMNNGTVKEMCYLDAVLVGGIHDSRNQVLGGLPVVIRHPRRVPWQHQYPYRTTRGYRYQALSPSQAAMKFESMNGCDRFHQNTLWIHIHISLVLLMEVFFFLFWITVLLRNPVCLLEYSGIQRSSWSTQWLQVIQSNKTTHHHHPSTAVLDSCFEVFPTAMLCLNLTEYGTGD